MTFNIPAILMSMLILFIVIGVIMWGLFEVKQMYVGVYCVLTSASVNMISLCYVVWAVRGMVYMVVVGKIVDSLFNFYHNQYI